MRFLGNDNPGDGKPRLGNDGNTMIHDDYDVVVVGAGIGGLTAAALLAKRGLSTLVVEHHYLPGGCCTAIRREGFTFDVGPELLYGFEEKGYNPHRFVMNELEEQIDMIRHSYVYRMRFEDGTITFWRDQERFLGELCARFPHEEEGIRALFADMSVVYHAVMGGDLVAVAPPSEAAPGHSPLNPNADPAALSRVGELMVRDSRWLIDQYVSDPGLINFFDIVAATFTSCDLAETPAILTAIMFIDNHAGGSCYAADTPQMLSNLLEKAIEKHGGQMLYRQRAEEILMRDGAARGVRLANGTEIKAGAVVSNATVWNLYGKLVGERHIDPARMEWAHTFEPTFSFLVAYLGLDASVIPEDFGHVEMIVLDATGFEGEGNFNIELPSLEDPARCPPGTHAMTVVSPNRREWPSPWDDDYRSDSYEKLKAEEAELLLDRMEKVIPGIRSAIKVMEIGTPTTVERYTLRNWGNLGGPKPSLGRHMLERPRARSDWDKLYLCGDSTVMGEGVVASTSSGIGAANMVLRDLGLYEYVPHTFDEQYVSFVEGKPWTPAPARSVRIGDESVARRLAHECQLCEDAPCIRACPASIDIPGFLRRIEAGNLSGAAAVIRESNPLSEVCGLICPAERLCESVCTRLSFTDEPVRIAELHGWVCKEVPKGKGWGDIAAPSGKRVAIVGAGPAGLSAAHFLARAGHSVMIFDQAEHPGGVMRHAVPPFRLDDDTLDREISALTSVAGDERVTWSLGTRVATGDGNGETAAGLGVNTTVPMADIEKDYDAVYVAPGLGASRPLDLSVAEDAPPTRADRASAVNTTTPLVWEALDMLRQARSGDITFEGERVLVIGGGSVASDAALTAASCAAAVVEVICLEGEEDMPALASEIAELLNHGVSIFNGWGPRESVDGGVNFIRCTSVLDADGRFSPSFDETDVMLREADRVVVAVGQIAEPGLAIEMREQLDKQEAADGKNEGHGNEYRPRLPLPLGDNGSRVFVGGDLTRTGGTVVEAVADGRRAAEAIDATLRRPDR